MTQALSPWEYAARLFEPRPHRWPSPGAMARALDPGTRQTPALDAIDRTLVDLAGGTHERVMIFMPPQEGKSQRVSRRFPAWLLEQDPTLRVAIVSYDDERARRWGRDIRRDALTHPDLGISLMPDSKAAGRWHTRQGGGVYCAGITGGITGEPVDVLIIDDPVKGRAEAESDAHRKAAWDAWENNLTTRLSGRSRIVLMMTRWHTADLAGRILDQERDLWRVLSIPAIAEHGDPLGRAPGDELGSLRDRPPGYFHALSARMSAYVFRSLYQQAPTAPQGTMFLRSAWRYFDHVGDDRVLMHDRERDLRDCWRFITVDLAGSTRTAADFTVAAAWAMTGDRDLLLLDVARARAAEADHWGLVRPLTERWRIGEVGVESTMLGTALVRDAVAAGLPGVFDLRADKDKITRAIPYSSLLKQGRVWLRADAPWIDDWVGEHADFPAGSHDDQVDVGAYAAKQVLVDWHPVPGPPETANGHGEIDFMRVQM